MKKQIFEPQAEKIEKLKISKSEKLSAIEKLAKLIDSNNKLLNSMGIESENAAFK